jgi:hypothetical protein
MATTENIRKLEKQIAEGLEPLCPACGSRMKIEKGQGDTGSKAYNYYCLRETDRTCDLMPGTAYVPWYHVLWQAAQQRIVQLGFVAIASVTLVGAGGNIFGFLDFKINDEQPGMDGSNGSENAEAPNHDEEWLQASLLTEDSLKRVIAQLQKRLAETVTPRLSAEEQNLLWEGKLRLGMERYTTAPREYDKSKKYLLAILEDYNKEDVQGLYNLGEGRRNQIMEILADLITKTPFSREELERFIYYAEAMKYSQETRRGHHLGIAYYHLAEKVPGEELKYKAQSLLHYLNYVRFLIPLEERAFNEAELNAKNEVFSAIEEDFAVMRKAGKLPPAWNRNALRTLDRNTMNRDRRAVRQAALELEGYIKEQGWASVSTS